MDSSWVIRVWRMGTTFRGFLRGLVRLSCVFWLVAGVGVRDYWLRLDMPWCVLCQMMCGDGARGTVDAGEEDVASSTLGPLVQ